MKHILSRLVQAAFTLVGAVTILFLIVRLTPGDPAYIMLGDYATPELVAVVRERYGLDKSLPVQYLTYVKNIATGNFGVSYSRNQDVMVLVASAYPYTLALAIGAIVVTSVIGLPLGVLAALRRNTPADAGSMAIALLGVAAPGFLLALIMIYGLSYKLGWFPVRGAGEDTGLLSQLWYLALPALALAFNSAALVARTTRSALLNVLSEDYLRTARAKGLAPHAVLWGHTMRNALIPVLAVLGLQFGQLLGGAGVIEIVFGRPGLGKLLIDAILSRDYPLSQALITVLLVGVIVVNLVTDILYGFIDPRIRHA
jgi:peptide/nickel transport system permease protein/oligopeptide transport system permease protein